jgi:ligand-binding sensor domain-containing protein/signal transduction histidine kinase
MPGGKVRAIVLFLFFAPGFLLLASPAQCQQLPIRTYTTADGLPRNTIQRIFSDSRGSLWFCTGDGLSFFNGYEFITYHLKDGLPHPFINDIIEDRNGTLWVATNGGGVCEFHPYGASPSQSRFVVNKVGDTAYTNRVNNLYEDRSGNIWAGTDRGIFRLAADDPQRQFRPLDIELLKDSAVYSVTEDMEGAIWIGSNGYALVRLLPDGRVLRFTGAAKLRVVKTLLTDRQGRVWIGTSGPFAGEGIYVIYPEALSAVGESRRVPWRNLAKQDIDRPADGGLVLPTRAGDGCLLFSSRNQEFNTVVGLAESKRAGVWVITFGGVGEFDGRQFRIYTTAQGLATNELKTAAEDHHNNLWLATNEGGIRMTLNSFRRFGPDEGLKTDTPLLAFEDRAGNLIVHERTTRRTIYRFDGERFVAITPRYPPGVNYFGWGPGFGLHHRSGEWWLVTGAGLCRFPKCSVDELAHTSSRNFYTTRDGLQTNDIFGIFEDSRGDVWVGGGPALSRWDQKSETFRIYGESDGLPAVSGVNSFSEDRFGNLWISFYDEGIARYAGGRFTFFPTGDGEMVQRVRALHLDRKGRLWVGTDTHGVIRIDDTNAEQPAFHYYSMAQGLAANNISSITEDHFGRIYLSHPRGLDRLNPENGSIKHYSAADGLLNEIFSSYCDRQGRLWFSAVRGLYQFIPDDDEPGQSPPIFINRLRIAGHDREISRAGQVGVTGLELSPGQNQIEIGFFGLGFEAGESLRYQYLLEGAGQEWSSPGQQRLVTFASLAPGNYRFLVRAINVDGASSETPASFPFRILSPVWQRWWFIALVLALAGSLAYAFYRYRVARLLELERVRTRIAADLHDDIGANLTRIAILSEVAHRQLPETNSRLENPLTSIATIARESVASMSDIVWAINPRRDSLIDLVQRMRRLAGEIYAARNIDYQFLAPDATADLRLGADVRRDVFLIFKEAANNAARHSGCGRVEIELCLENHRLVLRIEDDGSGFDPSAANEGNGLLSMRRRAENLNGQLQIISGNRRGTLVLLKVPAR